MTSAANMYWFGLFLSWDDSVLKVSVCSTSSNRWLCKIQVIAFRKLKVAFLLTLKVAIFVEYSNKEKHPRPLLASLQSHSFCCHFRWTRTSRIPTRKLMISPFPFTNIDCLTINPATRDLTVNNAIYFYRWNVIIFYLISLLFRFGTQRNFSITFFLSVFVLCLLLHHFLPIFSEYVNININKREIALRRRRRR